MDAVFFGAHPDDVELTSAGLASRLATHGHEVAIVDLTRGEAASRGSVTERAEEAASAAGELGVAVGENLWPAGLGGSRSGPGQPSAVRGRSGTHPPTA